MKVVVFDIMNEPIGLGTIIDREEVIVHDEYDKTVARISSPVIVMEDGEILRGYECWWIDYDTFVTINLIMLYKQKVKL